jgi:hypothetical protein
MQFAPAHLAERFGLFVLIALGESVVAVGAPAATASSIDVDVLLAVAAAFAFTAGLWWVYFHFAADAMRYALSVAQVQLDIARHVLSYGHLMFIAAVISVGVGMREVVGHPADHLSWGVVALLFRRRRVVPRDVQLHALGDVRQDLLDPPGRCRRRPDRATGRPLPSGLGRTGRARGNRRRAERLGGRACPRCRGLDHCGRMS